MIVSATTEKGLSSDLEGEKTTSLEWKSDEVSEQVACQEVKVSVAIEEDLEPENGVLELETKSSKLVQNIIQTAVDQFVRTEETATKMLTSELQTQAHVIKLTTRTLGRKQRKKERNLRPLHRMKHKLLQPKRSQSQPQWDKHILIFPKT